MIDFFVIYSKNIFTMLWEHMVIVFTSVVVSFLLAICISMIIKKNKTCTTIFLSAFIGIYCIPSLALFSFLIPILGLGKITAITALILYNQAYLIRSILAGFDSISPHVIDIAFGMGLGFFNTLFKVEIPLALPSILGGLKVATVSTSGIAVIASLVDAGGLGVLLFEGMRTNNLIKILWGILLISSFTIAINWILSKFEIRAINYSNGIVSTERKFSSDA